MLLFFIFLGFVYGTAGDKESWWRYTNIYEILVSSFKDSNGDGIGDIKGITTKLDHFTDLQVDSIWITPFYESPKVDDGYDISNFTNVDPIFGTIEDFEELCQEADERDIKVIVDYVINHSSDEHIWFQKSIQKIEPFDEYYVWKDAKGYDINKKPIPPNNWLSHFGGSAWEWNNQRKQFYLHQFGKTQPDLNLRNENVKKEVKALLKFWVDIGVSGFRLDAVPAFIEDQYFRDEPLRDPHIKKDDYKWSDYLHIYTYFLPETFEFLRELRQFINLINKEKSGRERIMLLEAYGPSAVSKAFYGTKEHPISHFPFNFFFVEAEGYLTSTELNKNITEWLNLTPNHGVANWVAENHDRFRLGNRFSEEYVQIINILIMMLPGVGCLYYGQEIGMINNMIRPDQNLGIFPDAITNRPREPSRTPMQWDDSLNAGFTSKMMPWLPVNPNYWHINVKTQKQQKNSNYNLMKDLLHLRKTKISKYGAFNSYTLTPWIYAFTRELEGQDLYVVLINLGTETEMINLYESIPHLRRFLKVLVTSKNSGYKKHDIIRVKSRFPRIFVMKPVSAIVLSNNVSKAELASNNNTLND